MELKRNSEPAWETGCAKPAGHRNCPSPDCPKV